MHSHLSQNPFLSKIIKLAENHRDISVLWIYGSQADQTARKDSDYDLAIAFESFIKDPLERRLRPEKLAIQWTSQLACEEDKISIVDMNIIPTTLSWEIVSKGLPIFVRDNDRLVREEMKIYRQFEHDVHYHRRIYGTEK